MDQSNTKNDVAALLEFFECFELSPSDWPVHVSAAIAGDRARTQWPCFPQAATVEQGRLGHGRGVDKERSRTAAIGELIEVASCCDWGDLELEWHEASAFGQDLWCSTNLNGFSARQSKNRIRWNQLLGHLDWIPPSFDPNSKTAFLSAQSPTTGGRVLVPADFAIIGRHETGDPNATSIADTNGCAAGPTLDAAKYFALCEIVERDATGRWWYGRTSCPRLAQTDDKLIEDLTECLAVMRRRLHVFDVTSDFCIPTFAAISSDQDGGCLAAGFGTRLSPLNGLHCALTELMQMELKVILARQGKIPAPELEQWFSEVSIVDFPIDNRAAQQILAPSTQKLPEQSYASKLTTCLDRLESSNCAIAFLDHTRPEFGIPVVRAISPDLCHWKPRLGRARLMLTSEPDNPKLLRI